MKIQNEMATRISVDTVAAIGSMKAFRDAVSASGNAWRAQVNVLKSSGQYYDALKARISGLNQQIDLQKGKVAELRERQEGLDQTNRKQAAQWLSLEKQISQANKQLSGYESQLNKANSKSSYYASGLAELQHQTRLAASVSKSYVSRLRAEGNEAKASKEELSGLKTTLSQLKNQQSKQQAMLKQVAHESGKTSDAYAKQKIQLNQTAEAIAKTKTHMDELKSSMKVPNVSGWSWIRTNILRVDDAEKKAKEGAINYAQVLKANIMGGWIQQGFSSLISGTKSVITNGMAAAKVGADMQARWKNIGLSANGVKQLSAQVADLKVNTNLTAQSVNSLQSRFYGMTNSVSQTKLLTKGVASLSDQLKLSGQQANAFAGGISRIESSGKVTSRLFGHLEKQAPGLTTAMTKASGMSRKAFQDLIASGKMTSDQFNQILANASKNYDENSKAFGKTSGGALHKLQQEWVVTQAKLAQPLLKVSATGLNELNKALANKDTQRGLQLLAKGLASAAVQAAKFIGFVAKHQKSLLVFAGSIASLVLAFKGMQTVVIAADALKKFTDLMKSAKVVSAFSASLKGLKTAISLLTGGFNPWIIAIEAVAAGLVLLYKHSKTFRKFINGIWKSVKGFGKNIGKFFGNIGKTVSKGWRSITKRTSVSLRGMQRNREQYDRQQTKAHQKAMRENQRTWNTISRNTAKASKSMWRATSRDTRNGWNYVVRLGGRSTKNIVRGWDQMNRSTAKISQQMFRNHKQTFGLGYKVLQDRTRTWHDVMTGHWNRLSSDTQRTSHDMANFHRQIFRDMYNRLNNLTDGRLGDMVKSWQSKMGNIGDTVANAKKAIHDHFVDLVRGIIKPFNDMLEDLHKGINWVLEKVGASTIGGTWSVPMPGYAAGTPGTHPGGLAKVNDAPTSHYRELYRLPNGKMGMFPAVRNMVVPLPKGTSVLDGERSYQLSQMMGIIPHYVDGTLDAVGNFFSNLKDSAEDFMDNSEKFLAHPIEFMESVFKKFVKVSSPVKLATDLVQHVPVYIAKQMANWVKKQLEVLSNPGGAGVERWRPYITRAAKMEGIDLTATMMRKMLTQITTETHGDPTKIGGTDGLNDGHATGLLQFKPGTFRHWIWHGHGNIMNGFDQILAAFNALQHGGEGGWGNFGIPGRGWANGGLITQHGLYEVGEYNRPEMIVPLGSSKRSRAYQLLGEIVARFQADEPAHGATVQANSVDDEQIKALNRKFDTLLSMFSQLLGISSDQVKATKGISFDRKALYKQQALDAAMRSFS